MCCVQITSDALQKAKETANLPDYISPFENIAWILIYGQDFEHAQWDGEEDLPVAFSYEMLDCIERLPWKLVEVYDEPFWRKRWFRRAY
jgi:hypothetical protein